jgi:hypothetical protein
MRLSSIEKNRRPTVALRQGEHFVVLSVAASDLPADLPAILGQWTTTITDRLQTIAEKTLLQRPY